jgi:hypothetical protein
MASFQDVFANILGQQPSSPVAGSAYDIDALLAEGTSPNTTAVEPWQDYSGSYGLGSAPAPSMPYSLPGVQLENPPMLSTDPARFQSFTDMIGDQLGGFYDYDTPQADTALLDGAPQAVTSQFAISPELQRMLSGEGFSPQTLAYMNTQAREAPAMAGRQQMGQMKRILGESGIEGPAAAAMLGDVARNTGYQQGQNLQNVAIQNAQQANQNMQFGIGQQSNIGLTNMQQANMMALQNANMMFQALRENQQAQNSMNQFNTGNQVQQQQQKAATQSGFTANAAGSQLQQANANEVENANKEFGADMFNAQNDWQTQLLPWQELNQRYSQAAGTLGSWGQ